MCQLNLWNTVSRTHKQNNKSIREGITCLADKLSQNLIAIKYGMQKYKITSNIVHII